VPPGHLLHAKITGNPDAATLHAIEALHEQDITATLANDARALANLWAEDAVRMEPGGSAEVGRAEIAANDLKAEALTPKGAATLSYSVDIRSLDVRGDQAWEWGTFDSSYRPDTGKAAIAQRGKFVRVLEMASPGIWKFRLVIWNEASS